MKTLFLTILGKSYMVILFIISMLMIGCQTDRKSQGQQYLDGRLDSAFSLSQPQLSLPINVADYLEQVSLIKAVSPSLYEKNKTIYEAIETWVALQLPVNRLNQVGLSSYQASGQDNLGNVHLTGYYTPVLKARHKPDHTFRYPLYAKPQNNALSFPTREQIYDGALSGQQLEIAYTSSLIDNFLMEVQGSGYIDFEDGEPLVFLGYSGKNGHPYQSIGRLLVEQGEIKRDKVSIQAIKSWADKQDEQTVINLLKQNASAVFFKPQHHASVVGSAGVPLVAKASVASDSAIIPAGSIMLVDIPLLDKSGIYQGQRELRLVIALDVGGAIKNQHLDIYQGIGSEAGHQAGYYNHFGRVWLIKAPSNSHLLSPSNE